MKRALVLTSILLGGALIAAPAMSQASVTVGSGGFYPPGTTFNGVPINGLQSGYGVQIAADNSAHGQFCTVLLGVSALGQEQKIIIEGKATSGEKRTANVATFSGTCTVNLGDGTPPTPGVPFTATITSGVNDQGTIGLVIGATTLPDAIVNLGSMTIE